MKRRYNQFICYITSLYHVYRTDMRPIWLGLEEVVGRGRHRWQEDMSQVTWTKWKKGTKYVYDFLKTALLKCSYDFGFSFGI